MEAKIIKRLYAVMDKDFEYAYYCKMVVEKGERLRIRNGRGAAGHQLIDKGVVLVLGHGANEVIPREYFHLEEEIVEQVERRRVRRV